MKKVLIVLPLVLLIAAGCKKAPTQNMENQNTNQTTKQQQTTPGEGQGSFSSLLALGLAQKCDVSFSANGVTSAGTTYFAKDKMHTDTTTNVAGKSIKSHTIMVDGYIYSWIEGTPFGTKMMVDSSTSASASATGAAGNASSSQALSLGQDIRYDCSAWIEDPNTFKVPSGITFSTVVMPK